MSAPTRVYFDVENTLRVPFISGIQRVVREVSRRLDSKIINALEFIPVVYCPICHGWRKLCRSELDLLTRTDISNETANERPSELRKLVSYLLGSTCRDILRNLRDRHAHPSWHRDYLVPTFEAGSIFLDLDASWHNALKRNTLLPALKESKVHIVTLHYDIIPLLFPDMTHEKTLPVFSEHLHSHIQFSDLFVCISQNTEKDLLAYARQVQPSKTLNTTTIKLGSDISKSTESNQAWPLPEKNLKYIICVGTLEPRKNYQTVLDAFDMLSDKYVNLNLVLVGREGWHAHEIVERIHSHELFNNRLFWFSGIDNALLHTLYENAFLAIVPSFYEGFGLPVIEALQRGCVTLASNAGSLPEAGGDYCDYFDPTKVPELVKILQHYLDNDDEYSKQRDLLQGYVATSWDSTVDILKDTLKRYIEHAET